MVRPQQLENIDWSSVIAQANNLLDNPSEDDDDAHYLYEEVMMTVFGKDVFDYINN